MKNLAKILGLLFSFDFSIIETIQDLKSLFKMSRVNREALLMQGRAALEDCGDEDGGYETSSSINELS